MCKWSCQTHYFQQSISNSMPQICRNQEAFSKDDTPVSQQAVETCRATIPTLAGFPTLLLLRLSTRQDQADTPSQSR